MILSAISIPDCLVFVVLLIPQLLIHVPILTLLRSGLDILPFFLFTLPTNLVRDRYLTPRLQRPAFVQHATFFQDLVIRCVRFAFARFPAAIGRIFFSKPVAYPFTRWRMLRHGILRSPVPWREIDTGDAKGLWISGLDASTASSSSHSPDTGSDSDSDDDSVDNVSDAPDIVVYYIHGGGFAMGSAYFYLEPLIALRDLLRHHYSRPAIFALEYSLVPDATYPTQLDETLAGYEYVLRRVHGDASRIVVAGDSAGGTLALSLLLHLARPGGKAPSSSSSSTKSNSNKQPGFAALISPWTHVSSTNHHDTASDYLSAATLRVYGTQYARTHANLADPLVSPGECEDAAWWREASPRNGIYVTYGSEEVLGPDVRALVRRWRAAGVRVAAREEPGGIHAWAIARLFLEEGLAERARGMRGIVEAIRENVRS